MKISQGLKKVLIPVAKLAISVLALYFVFSRIPLSEVKDLVYKIKLAWIAPALLLFVLSKWLSAHRLNLFFSSIGCHLNNTFNLKLYVLGMYYNLFLPGGIGGDGYKVYLLNRKFGYPAKDVFWAVMLDRVTGVTALFCLALALSFALDISSVYIGLAWGAVPLVLFFTWFIIRLWFKKFTPVFALTTLQSFLVQILQVLSALCILFSLGENTHVEAYMLVFLISSIVAVFPFTIGGVGAREVTFLFGSTWLGLNTGVSVALSLVFYLITALVSLAGIYFSFFPGELSKGTSSIPDSLSDAKDGVSANLV